MAKDACSFCGKDSGVAMIFVPHDEMVSSDPRICSECIVSAVISAGDDDPNKGLRLVAGWVSDWLKREVETNAYNLKYDRENLANFGHLRRSLRRPINPSS